MLRVDQIREALVEPREGADSWKSGAACGEPGVRMVELEGIEPSTSSMPLKRSPE